MNNRKWANLLACLLEANILSILPGCARVNNWSNAIRAQCKLWLTTKWNKHGKQAFWGAFNYSNVWPLFTLLTRQGRDGKLSLLVQIIVECWCWMVVALMVGSREMLATNCLLSVSHALEQNRLCPPWLQHQFRCSPPLRQLSESSVNTHIHRGSHKQTPQEHRQKFWVVHFLHPSFINKEQVEWIHQNLVEFIYEEPLDPCYAIRPMASVVLIIDLCAINVGCRILLHSLLFVCLPCSCCRCWWWTCAVIELIMFQAMFCVCAWPSHLSMDSSSWHHHRHHSTKGLVVWTGHYWTMHFVHSFIRLFVWS